MMFDLRTTLVGLLGLFTVILLAGSCKKYDEGGRISEARSNITQEWNMNAAFENGIPVGRTRQIRQIGDTAGNWRFLRGGELITHNGTNKLQGTWQFMQDKRKLQIEIDTPFYKVRYYDILRLDATFMVWRYDLGSDTYRFEFESVN